MHANRPTNFALIFFVEHFSNHASVTYKEPAAKANQYPKTIEKVYETNLELNYTYNNRGNIFTKQTEV